MKTELAITMGSIDGMVSILDHINDRVKSESMRVISKVLKEFSDKSIDLEKEKCRVRVNNNSFTLRVYETRGNVYVDTTMLDSISLGTLTAEETYNLAHAVVRILENETKTEE